MKFRKFGTTYFVRLNKGEEIINSLADFCQKENIKLASVTGIGASNKLTIGLYDTEKHKYLSNTLTGEFEITSLMGNITTQNGIPYIHIHINIADQEHKTFGGHLSSAFISATGEIVINTIEGIIERKYDDKSGLNLI